MAGRDFSLSDMSVEDAASLPLIGRRRSTPRAALTLRSILVKLQEYEDLSLRGHLGELSSDESDFQCNGDDIHD